MSNVFVLDACALIAVLANENGADVVRNILSQTASGDGVVLINKLNLLEVYYHIYRIYGKASADSFFNTMQNSQIEIRSEITDAVFKEAGRLKSGYKVFLADAVALAETVCADGALLTSDHHEFDNIEQSEKIRFIWIR